MKRQPCPHCHNPISLKTTYCPICGRSLKPQSALSLAYEYAALGPRLLARLIDYTLIGILVCLVDWNTQGALMEGWEWFRLGILGLSQITISLWLAVILFLGYFVIFQSLSGQTPGKWLCRVIVLKRGKQMPGLFSSLFRELGVWLTLATGGWLFLVLICSSKNKGFHDFLAGVEVYQVPESL